MSILFKHKVNWKYAIGEVILIFIGITLAISFNNWNEERKERVEVRDQVEAIYLDLIRDTSLFKEHVQFFNREYNSVKRVLELYENPNWAIKDTSLFFLDLATTAFNVDVKRANCTWDELQTSGNSFMLNDNQLVKRLQAYYSEYDGHIANYLLFPLETRYEVRTLLGELYDLKTAESFEIIPPTDIYSTNWTLRSKPSAKYVKRVRESSSIRSKSQLILMQAKFHSQIFNRLSEIALSIIEYIEENYSDTINLE